MHVFFGVVTFASLLLSSWVASLSGAPLHRLLLFSDGGRRGKMSVDEQLDTAVTAIFG
jgi:hypothetical protein